MDKLILMLIYIVAAALIGVGISLWSVAAALVVTGVLVAALGTLFFSDL